MKTNTAQIKVIVIERGNGFPVAGDYVPGSNGNLYRIVSLEGSIQTGQPGQPCWMMAKAELADWEDCEASDEFRASIRDIQ